MDRQDAVGIWIGDYCGAQHMAIRLHVRGCHNVAAFERPAAGGSLEFKEVNKEPKTNSVFRRFSRSRALAAGANVDAAQPPRQWQGQNPTEQPVRHENDGCREQYAQCK
jgi:hypothetical protein